MISMQALCVCLDYQLALSTPIDAWLCRTYVQAQHTWPANLLSRPCKFGLRMFSIFSAKNYSRHLRFSRLRRAGQRKKFLLRRFLHRALKKQRSACPKKTTTPRSTSKSPREHGASFVAKTTNHYGVSPTGDRVHAVPAVADGNRQTRITCLKRALYFYSFITGGSENNQGLPQGTDTCPSINCTERETLSCSTTAIKDLCLSDSTTTK